MSELERLSRENTVLRQRIANVEQRLFTPLTGEEQTQLTAAQARADGVAGLYGERALPPIVNERPLEYRQRLLQAFMPKSANFKNSRATTITDSGTMDAIEAIVYADAAEAARGRGQGEVGILIPIVETDSAGRRITKYTGDPMAWMAPFMRGGQRGSFIRPAQSQKER